MSRTLTELSGAIIEDLGEEVAALFPSSFIERVINEAQRRMEPDILLPKAVTVSIAADDTTYALPTDAFDVISWQADATIYSDFPEFQQIGGTLYFTAPAIAAWSGTLFYRAHYPTITPTQACTLPDVAADGIISFALYRCFRRLAAGRAEYKKFATIVGNGTSMADLENAAAVHLADFKDSVSAAVQMQPPLSPYSG